jgi:hypothetical protein
MSVKKKVPPKKSLQQQKMESFSRPDKKNMFESGTNKPIPSDYRKPIPGKPVNKGPRKK